ncbi:MAG TPA: PAS domain S-box protein [Thermoanaerobaculaceae bacterium]|nr:PAS domain S-box protein [Thermoanaerobaculaceae bacterium]
MSEPLRVLIVEDAAEDAELATSTLRKAGVDLLWRRVETEGEFIAALADFLPDLILSDYSMPAFTGMAALELALARVPHIPFIVYTGSINEETAVECMKAGAWDYVLKDRMSRLPLAVRGALNLAETRLERSRAESDLRATEKLTQSIIDSLSSSVAVVSPSGEIVQVNRAWRQFAQGNGGSEATSHGIGLDYLGITRAALPDATATQVLAGMHAVLSGETPSFALEYPCHSPESQRWFVLNVTPLSGSRQGLVMVHSDISNRKLTEAALAESEQRYRSLFEQSPIGIYRTTPDGRILMVNPAIREMLGYGTSEELASRNLEDQGFSPDYSRERFKELLAREGEVRGLESCWTTKDHRKLLVIENARAIRDVEGTILHYEGTVEDITTRKLAEQQVLTERARFRALTESAPFGMRLSDAAGTISYLNPSWIALFGYTLEDTPTLEVFRALVYPNARQRAEVAALWEADRPARDRGDTVMRPMRVTCKDGSRKVILMTTTTLEGGQALTTCVDVTERTAAEEAQRRLATAIEQAADGTMITDPDGTIQYVNPAFERITGFTREEAVGRNPRTLKSGAHDETFYTGLWRAITMGDTWHGRFVDRRRDGSSYEGGATITPIRDEHGQIVNFVATQRDVTHEVLLQHQLNQAQKMEAVGRLAGGIAHDFNNLLQAIMSEVGVLRHRMPANALGAETLDDLGRLVRRGAGLTRQLLLFSRQQISQPEGLDLAEVVSGSVAMLRRIVRENVEFVAELGTEALPVRADRGQLEQVLMNLVVNASDAMPEGGRVTLRAGSGGDVAWFSVSDTGSGIPESVRSQIFEPFFTTKPVGKGTGLGLSVVHGIVTSHGGSIDVASKEGEGTTFIVRLPQRASEESPKAPSAPEIEPLLGGGERILVVEDEEGAREGIATLLGILGYDVTAVGSGEEVRALPSDAIFDVLLTDVTLPDVKGDFLAVELLERWPAIRVVLMSGYSEDEATRRLVATQSVGFLQKPFEVEALSAAIRGALEHRDAESGDRGCM